VCVCGNAQSEGKCRRADTGIGRRLQRLQCKSECVSSASIEESVKQFFALRKALKWTQVGGGSEPEQLTFVKIDFRASVVSPVPSLLILLSASTSTSTCNSGPSHFPLGLDGEEQPLTWKTDVGHRGPVQVSFHKQLHMSYSQSISTCTISFPRIIPTIASSITFTTLFGS
jgi:hypothetical protein